MCPGEKAFLAFLPFLNPQAGMGRRRVDVAKARKKKPIDRGYFPDP